jgi:quinol-cytochrome oxidoreductase complex cytochrome b subunit
MKEEIANTKEWKEESERGLHEDIKRKREDVRTWLTFILVCVFLGFLITPLFFFAFKPDFELPCLFDFWKNISAILSGIVGLVLGFYFRIEKKE